MSRGRAHLTSENARLSARADFFGGHDRWHLMLVTGGGCQEEAGQVHDLARGSIRLSSPNERHRLFVGDDGLRCTLFFLPDRWIGSSVPGGNLFLRDERLAALLEREDGTSQDAVTSLRRDLNVREAMANLTAAAGGKDIGLVPSWIEDSHCAVGGDPRASIQAIANSAKVTREHFARTFARYYGCSPAEHRSAHKLLRAVELLRGSDMPIADIAQAAGFSDQSHLNRAVAARFGLTPARLRRGRTGAAGPSEPAFRNSRAR